MEELLVSLGCRDIEETKARFLDDKDFYLQIVKEVLSEPGFEKLGENLGKGEIHPAFETAHMLKGIISNCGLSSMVNIIEQIVEPLRDQQADFQLLTKLYGQLLECRNDTLKIIGQKERDI